MSTEERTTEPATNLATPASTEPAEGLSAESLIEEVSIDGMCGVY